MGFSRQHVSSRLTTSVLAGQCFFGGVDGGSGLSPGKNGGVTRENGGLTLENDDLTNKNDDFTIKNEDW